MLLLNISTDNAAFEDGHAEVVRILRDTADRIEQGEDSGNLRDINGNKVGSFTLDAPDE